MAVLGFFCRSREFRKQLEESRERLYRVAYAWTHNPDLADDLTQECLSKALKYAAQLRDAKAMNGWLFRILSNCWTDHLRAQKDTVDFEEAYLDHQNTPEKLNIRLQHIDEIRLAMESLPLGQRQTVSLVDIEGFSYAEVAEILEVPVGTVMSRLCRARRNLKDQLLQADVESSVHVETFRRIK